MDLTLTLPPLFNAKPYFLKIADDQLAKNGDKVIDTHSQMEGVLNFGLWYWTVTWSDDVETIVADPLILKIK